MKKLLAAASVAVILSASSASAVTRQINFSFGPLDEVGPGGAPYGLGIGDTIEGSFTFDDTGFSDNNFYALQPIMLSLDFTTGTRTWSLSEVTGGTIHVAASNVIDQWYFYVSGADGHANVYTDNSIAIYEPAYPVYIDCNNCSSFQEVPLPATSGLAMLGLGALGSLLFWRKKTA